MTKEILELILYKGQNRQKEFEGLAGLCNGNEVDKLFYVLSCFNIPNMVNSLSPESVSKLSLYFDTQDRSELKKRLDYFVNLKGKKYWDKYLPEKFKMPINALNCVLTTKLLTFAKIERVERNLINRLKKETNPEVIKRTNNRISKIKKAKKMAEDGFLDKHNFSVYEQYALFGGLKLLYESGHEVVQFKYKDLLKVMGFEKINKREITRVGKAIRELSERNFPCYPVYFSGKGENEILHTPDEKYSAKPIFKISKISGVYTSYKAKKVSTTTLHLELRNKQLRDDISRFYILISGDIIANLREFKKRNVREWDLYFIEFIIKDSFFKSHRKIELAKFCEKIKKYDYLNEYGYFKDKFKKSKFKTIASNMADFCKKQSLLNEYVIENGIIKFQYNKSPLQKELKK